MASAFENRSGVCVRFVMGAAALLASVPALAQFPAQGIRFHANITLTQFGVGTGGNGNDCWGYVSPSGREYAIMGLSDRVAFVEITNPDSPSIRASIPHTSSLWAGIKTHGAYCYVSNESGGGIQVIDMTNIDTGVVTLVRTITGGPNTAHTLAVNNATGYLYIAGANLNGGALMAYSLANPSNPTLAGSWSGPYTHEAQIVSYTSGPYAGKEVAFCHNGQTNFAVVDVTNKAAMTTMGTLVYPNLRYCHQGWLSADKRYVYVNDELDGTGAGQSIPNNQTRVINVENLNAPTLEATFNGPANSIDHNLYVRGNYIFQSNYTSGLRVFDNSSSGTAPVEVAWIDTHPEDDALTYNGTWSNYPFFPSGRIIISDINRGLVIVSLNLDFLTLAMNTPTRVEPTRRTPITVTIGGGPSPVNPSSVALNFRLGTSGAFTAAQMTQISPTQFRGYLPPVPCGGVVQYYASAANTNGNPSTFPLTGASAPISADAYSSISTYFSYDMETAAGWSVGGAATGDTATLGLWERGDPQTTAAQPEDDHTPDPGVNCWMTGLTAGASVGAFDLDGGTSTLLSPVINLASAAPDVRIGYWRWYSNDAGSAPNADTFRIGISNNGGTSWTVAETIGPAGVGTSGGWIYSEFRVADRVAPTANMRMRFVADDAASGSVIEAGLDDFAAFARVCNPPCPADLDDGTGSGEFDGGVDINDLIFFLQAFEQGSIVADLDNGTGTGTIDDGVDVNDLIYFLTRFEAGC